MVVSLVAFALVTQFYSSLTTALSGGIPVDTSFAHFFSYFTILSNTIAVVAALL